MTKIDWSLIRYAPSSVDVTSSVLSFSYTQGRQNYLDPYSGGTLTVTLNNNANIAQYFTFNSVWALYDDGGVGSLRFWTQNVQFNDYPGNTGLSTITVSLVDVLGRNGRNVVSNVVLAEAGTIQQLQTLWQTLGFQIGDIGASNVGSSRAAATTYSGSMLNYFNLITATEKGLVSFYDGTAYMIARNAVSNSIAGKSFTRDTPDTNSIVYMDFSHNRAGMNFMNTVTIAPQGLANQTGVNSTSVTAYGTAQQTITTVDYNTTQADGLADWLAFSQSDPDSERWSVSFMDIPQNFTALNRFINAFMSNTGYAYRVWNLYYRVPGAVSDTLTQVVIEGITVNATPDKTIFTVYFSDIENYQFFTLNSSVFGILDTSRLGF
jgi:hypothetical protein